MSATTIYQQLRATLTAANQQQLLAFWDDLTDDEKNTFQQQINAQDYAEVNAMFVRAIHTLNADVQKLDALMQPIPDDCFASEMRASVKQIERYRTIGLHAIAQGQVGVILLAGGQGTRLGVAHPKGMYSLDLPSGKTLFQIQAERIQRLQQLAHERSGAACTIVWYIMTSGPTARATREFLKRHAYFGLDAANVVLFQQGLLPCFDMEGRILLDGKGRMAVAPDGNGGLYRSLREHGVLEDMRTRGVRYLHAYSVDNVLVRVGDPVFMGYCIDRGADCGAKVVQKASPREAVGVVCRVDDHFQVVEYSEITDATADRRNADGSLVFNAGNICNHFFALDFLDAVASQYERKLTLHVAKKKIPHVNADGVTVQPTTPNGIKIEKFIFDVFQFSDRFVTWEVSRHSEFSALKNGDAIGKDCPSTARTDLFGLHREYVERAGGKVVGDIVEISPLLSYAGENLEAKVKGKVFHAPLHLTVESEPVTISNGSHIM